MLRAIKGETRSLDNSSYEGNLSQPNSYKTPERKIVGSYLRSFHLTITVSTIGNKSSNSPLIRAPLRTVSVRERDPTDRYKS